MAAHATSWFLYLMLVSGFFLIFGSALAAYILLRGWRKPPRGFDVTPGPVSKSR